MNLVQVSLRRPFTILVLVISLAFVPTVVSPGRLNLRVRPQVSQLSTQGAVNVPLAGGSLTIPALTVRRAETTIELGSGQSFAIAGLLERTSIDATNALPGIGELPVLGTLFKSNDFQRNESELVIIVTPYLVHHALDQFKAGQEVMILAEVVGNGIDEITINR